MPFHSLFFWGGGGGGIQVFNYRGHFDHQQLSEGG